MYSGQEAMTAQVLSEQNEYWRPPKVTARCCGWTAPAPPVPQIPRVDGSARDQRKMTLLGLLRTLTQTPGVQRYGGKSPKKVSYEMYIGFYEDCGTY